MTDTLMANEQGVAVNTSCGPNFDLYFASVTTAMQAKVYAIPDLHNCGASLYW